MIGDKFLFIFLGFIILPAVLKPASAQDLFNNQQVKSGPQGFYESDSVTEYFDKPLKSTRAANIALSLPKNTAEDRERDKQAKLKQIRAEKQQSAKKDFAVEKAEQPALAQVSPFVARAEDNQVQENESLGARLAREYHSPQYRDPVKAQEDQPEAVKAGFAALEAGDDYEAYKYALRELRYEQDLMAKINRKISLKEVAREELAGASPEELSERYPEYSEVLKKRASDLAKQREQENAYGRELSKEAEVMLNQIKARAHDAFNNNEPTASLASQLDEKTERAKAREILQARYVPKASDGAVDIMLFIRLGDKNIRAVAGDIEMLYRRTLKEKNLRFVALALDSNLGSGSIQNFRRDTKTSFPIESGYKMSRELGVAITPTAVFAVKQTKKMRYEEGLRNFYFYDELLNIMTGR